MAVEYVERLLWERYRLEHDQEARDCLFLLYAPWATAIARNVYSRIRPSQMEFCDYVQNATVGLLEAMSRFDVTRGIEFKLYGKPRVRGAVFNGLRVFISESKATNRSQGYSDRLMSFESEETKDHLDEVVDSVVGLGIGYMLDIVSGDEVTHSGGALAYAHSRQIEALLLVAVESLPDRLRMIISAHYFQHVPFQKIALQLGLTKGRISQLHRTAIGRIRTLLENRDIVG